MRFNIDIFEASTPRLAESHRLQASHSTLLLHTCRLRPLGGTRAILLDEAEKGIP